LNPRTPKGKDGPLPKS